MKNLLAISAILTSSLLLTAQTFWKNPITDAEAWLLSNLKHQEIKGEVPHTFDLVYHSDELLQFQYNDRGKTEKILVYYTGDDVHKISHLSSYQNIELTLQRIAEAGFTQIAKASDNQVKTIRFVNSEGTIALNLTAHVFNDLIVVTKEVLKPF